jgi:hypothetical protein
MKQKPGESVAKLAESMMRLFSQLRVTEDSERFVSFTNALFDDTRQFIFQQGMRKFQDAVAAATRYEMSLELVDGNPSGKNGNHRNAKGGRPQSNPPAKETNKPDGKKFDINNLPKVAQDSSHSTRA